MGAGRSAGADWEWRGCLEVVAWGPRVWRVFLGAGGGAGAWGWRVCQFGDCILRHCVSTKTPEETPEERLKCLTRGGDCGRSCSNGNTF